MMQNYADILALPHHISTKRKHMPLSDRAAQFAPFAALTGFEAAITEAGRKTDSLIELDDHSRELLDWKQQYLLYAVPLHPTVGITYFIPDSRKTGGAYVQITGTLEKIDPDEAVLYLTDGTSISFEHIVDLSY